MRADADALARLCGRDDSEWSRVAYDLEANAELLEIAAGRVERMAKAFNRWARMAMKAGVMPEPVQPTLPSAETWSVIEGGQLQHLSTSTADQAGPSATAGGAA